jgi:hypothetical protein
VAGIAAAIRRFPAGVRARRRRFAAVRHPSTMPTKLAYSG